MEDTQINAGLYCGVLQKRLTKIQDRVCPLKNSKDCMWKHKETGKCVFTSANLTLADFCKRVGVVQPTESEIELRKTKLKLLLKSLEV